VERNAPVVVWLAIGVKACRQAATGGTYRKPFKRSLEYYRKRGVTNVSELGNLAGARAEKQLRRWALKQGYTSVRTTNVKLGIGKFSSDAKWSPGKLILDFKKSRAAIKGDQSSAFKLFANQNGYDVYYIIGKP
jgi:hypothetical protein